MGRKNILPTLTWKDAPDTINPEILSKILGCSKKTAEKYFNEKDFPLLDKLGLKADKEATRLYIQGFRIKQNPKNCAEQLILLELKKINSNLEERSLKVNEEKAI